VIRGILNIKKERNPSETFDPGRGNPLGVFYVLNPEEAKSEILQ
jgi:hypothetical protein